MAFYEVYVKWTPRDLLGRFAAAQIDGVDSYGWMVELQLAGAEAASNAAPSNRGFLADEMFIGQPGSNSRVSAEIATVSPGRPYAPSQDLGFTGSIDPDSGKYYTFREWAMDKGIPENEVYAVARSLSYEGKDFMLTALEEMMMFAEANVGVLLRDFLFDLGFK